MNWHVTLWNAYHWYTYANTLLNSHVELFKEHKGQSVPF